MTGAASASARAVALVAALAMLALAGCTPPMSSAESTAAVPTAGADSQRTGSPQSGSPSGSSESTAVEPFGSESLDLRAGVDAATEFAVRSGLEVSITVIDRSNGQEVDNGTPADTPIFTASLAKLFIADNLLHRQRAGEFQLSPADRSLIEAMLRASDDTAARSLYDRYGGEAMITEVAQRYGLPTLAPTRQPGFWELTTISARDLARYYDRFLTNGPPADRDYVLDLLRHSSQLAADGFNQWFGIPTALPRQTVAIKQGWMCCPRSSSYLHTSGILGADNRYSVAILTVRPNTFDNAFYTSLLDQVTSLIFPPGTVLG